MNPEAKSQIVEALTDALIYLENAVDDAGVGDWYAVTSDLTYALDACNGAVILINQHQTGEHA